MRINFVKLPTGKSQRQLSMIKKLDRWRGKSRLTTGDLDLKQLLAAIKKSVHFFWFVVYRSKQRDTVAPTRKEKHSTERIRMKTS